MVSVFVTLEFNPGSLQCWHAAVAGKPSAEIPLSKLDVSFRGPIHQSLPLHLRLRCKTGH